MTTKQIKRFVHESNLIEGYDDKHMDAQGLLAWDNLLDNAPSLEMLDHKTICKVQRTVVYSQENLQPEWIGFYRSFNKVRIRVGNHQGVAPENIDRAMDEWVVQLPEADPIQHHIAFEKIHPFVDGNGRTGRLLLWWHQLKRGEEPTLFLNAQKHEKYYPLFN